LPSQTREVLAYTYDIKDTSCWRDTATSFPPLCTLSPRRRLSAWRPPRWWPVRISGLHLTPWPLPANCKRLGCTVCCRVVCRCHNLCLVDLWCDREQSFARTPPLWFWLHRYTFYYTVKNKDQIVHDYSLNNTESVTFKNYDNHQMYIAT